MSKKAHADVRALAEQLGPGSSGRGRHSPLFRYLYERAEAFKQLLEDTRPSWDAITHALANEGLTNGSGKPLARRRVQRTWYAVEQAKGLNKAGQHPSAAVPAITPPVSTPSQISLPETEVAGPVSARHTFKVSSLKKLEH